MIKNKADAMNYINDRIGNKWEGKFIVINDITGEYFWFNANGARIFNSEKQITSNELADIIYKNRKAINKWYESM